MPAEGQGEAETDCSPLASRSRACWPRMSVLLGMESWKGRRLYVPAQSAGGAPGFHVAVMPMLSFWRRWRSSTGAQLVATRPDAPEAGRHTPGASREAAIDRIASVSGSRGRSRSHGAARSRVGSSRTLLPSLDDGAAPDPRGEPNGGVRPGVRRRARAARRSRRPADEAHDATAGSRRRDRCGVGRPPAQ